MPSPLISPRLEQLAGAELGVVQRSHACALEAHEHAARWTCQHGRHGCRAIATHAASYGHVRKSTGQTVSTRVLLCADHARRFAVANRIPFLHVEAYASASPDGSRLSYSGLSFELDLRRGRR